MYTTLMVLPTTRLRADLVSAGQVHRSVKSTVVEGTASALVAEAVKLGALDSYQQVGRFEPGDLFYVFYIWHFLVCFAVRNYTSTTCTQLLDITRQATDRVTKPFFRFRFSGFEMALSRAFRCKEQHEHNLLTTTYIKTSRGRPNKQTQKQTNKQRSAV